MSARDVRIIIQIGDQEQFLNRRYGDPELALQLLADFASGNTCLHFGNGPKGVNISMHTCKPTFKLDWKPK